MGVGQRCGMGHTLVWALGGSPFLLCLWVPALFLGIVGATMGGAMSGAVGGAVVSAAQWLILRTRFGMLTGGWLPARRPGPWLRPWSGLRTGPCPWLGTGQVPALPPSRTRGSAPHPRVHLRLLSLQRQVSRITLGQCKLPYFDVKRVDDAVWLWRKSTPNWRGRWTWSR